MSVIRLLLPAGRPRRWHQTLAAKLIADGHDVGVELREPKTSPSAALLLVEQLETLLHRRDPVGADDAVSMREYAGAEIGDADLTFDLTGDPTPIAGAIAPLYDGHFGEAARDLALMEGRAPEIALAASEGRRCLARGRPAIERPRLLASGRAAVESCLTTLIRVAAMAGAPEAEPLEAAARLGAASPIAFLAIGLAEAARRRLTKIVSREGHWRIGWRALDGAPDTLDALAWPAGEPWRWFPDDGQRYFADPFPLEQDGVTYVFCEEYPYATARGLISMFTLDANGRASAARPVLERPYHLSYPVVFRHDGRVWMMPESSANSTLELYVAESFPDRWRLHATLLSGLSISDATMFAHRGRWWLTGATAEPGVSTWDSLALYSSDSPVGPWRPSSPLPVLVDASAARPAGHVVCRNGALWRPAQDCTRGYGSGLSLCRIDELGEGVFRQTVARRLAAPAGAPGEGVHTLNRLGPIEVIDAVGPAARNWRSREVA